MMPTNPRYFVIFMLFDFILYYIYIISYLNMMKMKNLRFIKGKIKIISAGGEL